MKHSPMQTQAETSEAQSTRRQFLKRGALLTASVAAAGAVSPGVFAASRETIRLALIGCGNRGTGAVVDALKAPDPAVKLYAMADLDEERMDTARTALKKEFGDRVDVSASNRFIGFDAYRRAVDVLEPGDIAMCTTRAYIRPVHVEYAISKGINVFLEKPFANDPAGLHRLLRAEEEAKKKGVKIAAGFQCRHSPARQALIDKIREGAMGDIPLLRANRLGGVNYLGNLGDKANDFRQQMVFGKLHLFWVGGGHMVDYLIHQIDECCWIKDGWPVEVIGMGGRAPNSKDCGQNIDSYSMEFTFADGTKAFCGFRRQQKTRDDFATYIHGTKCAAQFSGNVHAPTVMMFKDQRIQRDNVSWEPVKDQYSPWQYEWNDFLEAIRRDRPYNELKRAVYSNMATLMGRAACHTGQTVTWQQMMDSKFSFIPNLDALKEDSEAPVKADANGQFPVPVPGAWKEV